MHERQHGAEHEKRSYILLNQEVVDIPRLANLVFVELRNYPLLGN